MPRSVPAVPVKVKSSPMRISSAASPPLVKSRFMPALVAAATGLPVLKSMKSPSTVSVTVPASEIKETTSTVGAAESAI